MATRGLRELPEVLEGLLQTTPLGIAVVDTELRFLEINSKLAAMNGQPREAHLGRLLAEVLPPDSSREQIIACMRHVLRTGESVVGEELTYPDRLESKLRNIFLASYHPLRRGGDIIGVYAFVEDITERRRAEHQRAMGMARERTARERAEAMALALGESEAHYRSILAALAEGVIVHAQDGSILTANPSAERILGLSAGEMTGQSLTTLRGKVFREDGSPFPLQEHPAMVALRTDQPVRNVSMVVSRPDDGRRVWLSVSAQPLRRYSDALPHMVVASFFDVTELKQALQSIYLSEQRFRSLVEATTQMVWTTDAEGRHLEDSPSWRAYTGQSLEEFLTWQRWLDAIHPEDRGRSISAWREALASKEPLRIENRVRRYDGEYRLFQVRAVPVLASDGSVREWIGTHTDISEARKAEAERARLLREAQEAVRARDEFLTVAAHELRTPLTSLRLHLQMLLRQLSHHDPELAEQLSARGESMERQISRLSSLVYMLLDVSRLSTGNLSLTPQKMDLASLVSQLAEAFDGEFQRVGGVLHVQGTEQPLVGIWDALRLEQVVVNLLSNAVRYGAGKPVELFLGREGSTAVLSVRDQGIGICEADLARIFGKFERAVSERNYGGLGLGLFITRQLVDAMGGSIEVQSKPGEGSTFTVRLPLEPPSYAAEEHAGEGV